MESDAMPVGETGTATATIDVDGFTPPRWLRNPHLAGLWANRVQFAPLLQYRRERWDTPDGDFLDLDWIDGEPNRPIVVACHGLEGCSQSAYVRRLMAQVGRQGWTGVALNYRGCSGEDNRSVHTYHSAGTDDLDFVVRRLVARAPKAPVLIAAYSLGGNIVGNWLGRHADDIAPQVAGAFFCSAPFLLAPCSRQLERLTQRLYLRHFLRTLRQKAAGKARAFPGHFDVAAAIQARTLREFDEAYTCVLHGFGNADDYYEHASCGPHLARIRVPTLVLNALDDPLVPPDSTPKELVSGSGVVELVHTTHGGHVGFVCKGRPNWLEEQILNWFDTCLGFGSQRDAEWQRAAR